MRKTKLSMLLILLILASAVSSAQTVTTFNAGSPELNFVFNGGEVYTFYIPIPQGYVANAKITITGTDYRQIADQPADVVMVMDTSGSMDWDNKMEQAREAELLFLANVDLNAIRIGLAEYSECPTPAQNLERLTTDRQLLENTIKAYYPQERTNMGAGMRMALDELQANGRPGIRKYMILMTDGVTNQYYDSNGNCVEADEQSSEVLADVRNMASRAAAEGVVIYAIAFGPDADQSILQEIATTTGGQYYFAPGPYELLDIYYTIAGQIGNLILPRPRISIINPTIMNDVWNYPQAFLGIAEWNADICGRSVANCQNFVDVLQTNIDSCIAGICNILFSITSPDRGRVKLSDLLIELGAPFNSKCNNNVCESCLANTYPYQCLRDKDCFDASLNILNPFVRTKASSINSELISRDFEIKSFYAIQIPNGEFTVKPDTGFPHPPNTPFDIYGDTVPHDDYGAAIFTVNLPNYRSGQDVRICAELHRINFKIGVNPFEPPTELLISSSRSVTGFFEQGGSIFGKGPFIFTAKVWLRE